MVIIIIIYDDMLGPGRIVHYNRLKQLFHIVFVLWH